MVHTRKIQSAITVILSRALEKPGGGKELGDEMKTWRHYWFKKISPGWKCQGDLWAQSSTVYCTGPSKFHGTHPRTEQTLGVPQLLPHWWLTSEQLAECLRDNQWSNLGSLICRIRGWFLSLLQDWGSCPLVYIGIIWGALKIRPESHSQTLI